MKKKFLTILMAFIMLLSTQNVVANSYSINTKGYLGPNNVRFSLGNADHDGLYQYKLYISSDHRLEEMGFTNINVVTKNGGGSTGGSKKSKNCFSLNYGTATYKDVTKCCSAHFYVKSDSFGSTSMNLYAY